VVDEEAAFHEAPGFADAFLVDGKRPAAGATRRALALADTLDQLAHAGLADFYRGDVGREIAADLERIGAPVTRRDLESYRAQVVEPLALRLKRSTVYTLPPPSQGLASLLLLGLFERLNVAGAETPEHHHALIEAAKRACAIRDRVATDPAHLTDDPAAFLAQTVLDREAALIDSRRAAPVPPLGTGGADGVWIGAIDRDGLAVSYAQSLLWEFGSGCVLPATGILWQNRGAVFALDPKARNPLEPGRKPFPTPGPALAGFDDGRVLSYGATGGEGELQVQAQIVTRYADFGMGLADAVDAPRWLLGRTRGAASVTLRLEDRFDAGLIRALRELGHEIEELGEPYAGSLGHAGMLVKHRRDGRVEATHDPRADGGALGL
jgi:gamma-glutamyltranspeptidase